METANLTYSDYYDYYAMADEGEVTPNTDQLRQIQLIIAVVITSLGCLTNGLVLLLVVCRREAKTLPFLAVALLSLCDFVRNCSAILLIVGEVQQSWVFGDAVCKITRYLHFCSSITSSWHIVLAIFVRYFAAFRPNSCLTTLRFDRMVLFSLLTWLLVIIGSIPVVITYSAWEVPFSDPKVAVCIFQPDAEKSRALIISDAVVRFLVPFCVLILAAVLTLCKGCGSVSHGACCTKAVIHITPVIFTCLQLPVQVCAIYMYYYALDQTILELHPFADSLSYSSTVFNPTVQAFTTPEFRAVFFSSRCCAKRYDASKAEKRARKEHHKRSETEAQKNTES